MVAWAFALDLLGSWKLRKRFGERAKAIDGPEICPLCGSTDVVVTGRGGALTCPRCSELALHVRMTGES